MESGLLYIICTERQHNIQGHVLVIWSSQTMVLLGLISVAEIDVEKWKLFLLCIVVVELIQQLVPK